MERRGLTGLSLALHTYFGLSGRCYKIRRWCGAVEVREVQCIHAETSPGRNECVADESSEMYGDVCDTARLYALLRGCGGGGQGNAASIRQIDCDSFLCG